MKINNPIAAGLTVLITYVIGVLFAAAVIGAWRIIPELVKAWTY